jgi:hypothetical protein
VPNSMDVPHQDWKSYRIKFRRNMGSKKFNLMVYKYMRGGSKPIHVVVFKVPHGVPANDARVLSALDVCREDAPTHANRAETILFVRHIQRATLTKTRKAKAVVHA